MKKFYYIAPSCSTDKEIQSKIPNIQIDIQNEEVFLNIPGKGKIPIGGGGELNVNETEVLGGTPGRIFYENSSNQFSQHQDLFFNETNGRLSLGSGTAPNARLSIKAQGNLSTDNAISIIKSNNTNPILTVSGNHITTFYGQLNSTVGNKVSILNRTSYDARIELTSSNNITSSIWNDMNSSNILSAGLNIHNPGIVGASTSKINNIITSLPAYGEGNGFNWAVTSNAQGVFNQSERAMWLTPTKSLILYNGSLMPDTFNQKENSFEMYSSDVNSVAVPHFKCENGDTIKLYKQDWTNVTTIEEIIQNLQNLGL